MFSGNLLKSGLLLLILMQIGCSGTPTTTVLARDEVTSVLLVGHLVGGTVEFSNGFRRTIAEDDLQDEPVTDLGIVKDSAYQKLDKVLFRVKPGDLSVSFTSLNGKKTSRQVFIAPGIINELRLD